jgi:hypothetical protein
MMRRARGVVAIELNRDAATRMQHRGAGPVH